VQRPVLPFLERIATADFRLAPEMAPRVQLDVQLAERRVELREPRPTRVLLGNEKRDLSAFRFALQKYRRVL